MTYTSLRNSSAVDRVDKFGLPILISKTDHRHALIYWHGFPGPFGKEDDGIVRIADQVFDVASAGHDFYYPLYTDLGAGPFDFHASVAHGPRVLDFVRERKSYESVTVVGQSWGAVIALNAYDCAVLAKMILVTPFLGIPTGEAAERVLNYYAATYPEVLPSPRAEYLAQIERIAVESNPADVLKRPTGPLTIFAAAADQVVPLKVIQALRPASSKLIVLDTQTHDVEDRSGFRKSFADELLR